MARINFRKKTVEEFEALTVKDPNTQYQVFNEGDTEGKIYMGDVLMSGGGGGSAATPKIVMIDTTATIQPNIFYVWGEIASLDLTLAPEIADVENVYKFQFQSGDVATVLSLPQDIYFDGDFPNDIKTKYIVTIISGIAKIDRLQKQSLLPTAYQQVEYLQSSGSQYIDTGVNGDGDYTLTVEMQGNVNEIWWFGSRTAINSNAFLLANGGNNGYTYGYSFFNYGNNNGNVANSSLNDGQRHSFSIDRNNVIIDGNVIQTLTYAQFTSNVHITLFAFNENGTVKYANYKVYRSTIKNGSTILQDLYPCYRKSDNVAGMYDIVNDVFLTNAGVGSFVVGADVQ